MSEAINYITEDKHAVIETDMSEFKDCKVEDVPEYLFAEYLNHLIEQIRLCWEVIRNKEAKS